MSMAKSFWLWVGGSLWLTVCMGSRTCAQESAPAAAEKNPVIQSSWRRLSCSRGNSARCAAASTRSSTATRIRNSDSRPTTNT